MKPAYLTDPKYLAELVPLHTISALADVEADAETKALCSEVARSMLRLRDKIAGRPVRCRETGLCFLPPDDLTAPTPPAPISSPH